MNFHFEYLRHGKALCGKVFKGFVETFNFHNDFIRNLTGDADLPIGGGHVNVDTTDPSHPVIRCNGCGGKGGGGGGGDDPLHPWKVFGLKRSDDEANLFKIFAPGGELAGRKIYVGDELVPVDGLSLRNADGENGDYWSFDNENQITEDVSTLYIVVYLTPDTDGRSGDDEPQEFKFAAEMVLDPYEFKDESKVKAVYAVVPVANVCVLTDDGGVSSGSVAVQRLKTDVLYVSEYYR